MLEHIISRLALTKMYVDSIVVLVPEEDISKLSKVLTKVLRQENNILLFAGSLNNVLERFYKASLKYKSDNIIRATADNPFLSIYHLKLSLDKHIKQNSDLTYVANLPLGTGVEIISSKALKRAYKEAKTTYDKEHVSPYIHKNKDIFKILKLEAKDIYRRPDIRLTVDHREDFEVTKAIFKELYIKENDFTLEEIIKLWDFNELWKLNEHIQQASEQQ